MRGLLIEELSLILKRAHSKKDDTMKNLYIFLLIVLMIVPSCVQNSKHREVIEQRDTLLAQNLRNEAAMIELQTYIDEITASLDSIAYQEGMLFLPDPESPDNVVSKEMMKERLDAFEELVNRQQLRIKELEDSLNINNANMSSIRSLLVHMNGQIEQKNVQIEEMKKELEKKDLNIKRLKTTVASLKDNVDNLQQQTKEQEEILVFQNDLINEAYFLMGNRKELVSWGAMTGNKASSSPDLNSFVKVDIRFFTELEIPSARPKILTPMPISSYSLVKNGTGTSSLIITDPSEFWKASKILIIQLR